jgi:hypothetical protein
MTITYSGIADGCPYEVASGGMARCPRFQARAVFDHFAESVVTCAHVRCSIAHPDPDEGGGAAFYARCVLRTGDAETEREFVVPLD